MLRYKSNKKAFIMTALIILLCLVCLTGATLALFTSDKNDGTIGIVSTAGYIDIDIVDEEGKSLVDKFLKFHTSSEQKEILFEPGAAFYTQGFKIKNKGNVPVNFKLSVGKDNVIYIDGKPVDIKVFDEAFEVWITKNPTRTADAEELKPFKGTLGVDESSNESDIYYLVIKMKESADNKFQDKEYTGIGVTVYAVQGNVDIEDIKE